MSKSAWSLPFVGLLVFAQSCAVDDNVRIQGTWKLLSIEAEIQATGQKEPVMGQKPTGYVIFTADRRAMFMLTGEGRKAPKTVQDRADLLNSMIAYTGLYRLEGDKWITKVEVAWSPEFVDSEQMRFFKLDGDTLQVITTWAVHPNWPEKGMQRRIITFERSR